jgi:SAM-dependent methyltransferase
VAGEGESPFDVTHFFRAGRRRTVFDRLVLGACRGTVLDVGAGVGALALPLQQKGRSVTALETLPQAAEILRERGVVDVREQSLWTLAPPVERWDTVLVLMNGTTLAGTRGRLAPMLEILTRCLGLGGQILIDSTDLGPDPEDPGFDHPGELEYQFEYRGRRGAPFPQLFVDERALCGELERLGLRCESLRRDGRGRFLVRATKER